MSNEKATFKDQRTRNWTLIIYPIDGNPPAPQNWRDVLDSEHLQWIESPLHDKDVNKDGTLKKAHIHLLLLYKGKKSFMQIKALADKLNAPFPQKVENVEGLVRYMAHLDHPEKAQYAKADIISHGGADASKYLFEKLSGDARYELIRDMINFVIEHNIVEIADLLVYASAERFEDWFPLLCDNSAYIMGAMIKSRRHGVGGISANVNEDTGEITK